MLSVDDNGWDTGTTRSNEHRNHHGGNCFCDTDAGQTSHLVSRGWLLRGLAAASRCKHQWDLLRGWLLLPPITTTTQSAATSLVGGGVGDSLTSALVGPCGEGKTEDVDMH